MWGWICNPAPVGCVDQPITLKMKHAFLYAQWLFLFNLDSLQSALAGLLLLVAEEGSARVVASKVSLWISFSRPFFSCFSILLAHTSAVRWVCSLRTHWWYPFDGSPCRHSVPVNSNIGDHKMRMLFLYLGLGLLSKSSFSCCERNKTASFAFFVKWWGLQPVSFLCQLEHKIYSFSRLSASY